MKSISLKLDERIFSEIEKIREQKNISRNRYINMALEQYNKLQQRKILEARIKAESELVRQNSMDVLQEFESIEYEG